MEKILCGILLLVSVSRLDAIPNSFFGNGNAIPIIPAFPRFNADLTEEFLDAANWKRADFSGPWRDEPALEGHFIKRMEALPYVMGEVPMSVAALGGKTGTTEIVVSFLDAGIFFGYHFGGEKNRREREAGRERRTEFARHFKELNDILTTRLEAGCGRGTPGLIGRNPLLQTAYTDYQWDGFVLRLVAREDHSVVIRVFRADAAPTRLVAPEVVALDRRARALKYASAVETGASGDRFIRGIPMFTQGNTPFCGVHSLAMTASYLGLTASPEELAAAADFKNTGSAGGSDLFELHRAVADELGMRVSVAPSFEADRALRSVDAGLPVIVWRRVSAEREAAHRLFMDAFKKDATLSPPVLSTVEMEHLPRREAGGSPSHASVVTGLNEARGEVIYTEPWGEETRDRRMRIEEMEATAYAVFHFKL